MPKYYYNKKENSYAVTSNFEYEKIPDGFKEITEKKYIEAMTKLDEVKENGGNENEFN